MLKIQHSLFICYIHSHTSIFPLLSPLLIFQVHIISNHASRLTIYAMQTLTVTTSCNSINLSLSDKHTHTHTHHLSPTASSPSSISVAVTCCLLCLLMLHQSVRVCVMAAIPARQHNQSVCKKGFIL